MANKSTLSNQILKLARQEGKHLLSFSARNARLLMILNKSASDASA